MMIRSKGTPSVRAGDFVCTRNPSPVLRWPINRVQAFWELDGRAEYSHALRIINDNGMTFEAGIRVPGKRLHVIGTQDFYRAYAGSKVIIARHEAFDYERFADRFPAFFEQYCGRIYPYHRLVLMVFPQLMKYLNIHDFGVCSELVAKQLFAEGLMTHWKGVYPAWLADMAKHYKQWRVVYEGVL